jgi:UDP-sugar pyrophosphorylase
MERVGFTSLASELCFSPVKNATADGVALQANGTHPGVAATGESDQSNAICTILRSIGCDVQKGGMITMKGIEFQSGPDCVLKPSFAACTTELKKKFPSPSMIKISGNSSLVLSGSGLVVESLDLDGALVVECEEGATGKIQNLSVKNSGWVKVSDDSNVDEVIQMRGYNMNKINTETIVFKKDGSIEGNYPSSGNNGSANLTKPCAESSGRDIFCAGCAIM